MGGNCVERYSHYVILWKDIDVKYARVPTPANPRLYMMKYNDWIKYSTKRLFYMLSHFTCAELFLSSTFSTCGNTFFLPRLIFVEEYV